MRTFFFDYALNVLIALVILYFGGQLLAFAKNQYYTYAPIENFYESREMYAPDVCLGDKEQTLRSERYIKSDSHGYNAVVVRELFLVGEDKTTKVFDEIAYPFVEKTGNGLVYRVQRLPDLKLGDYQWVLHVTLKINDVVRDDVPLVVSNVFEVVECE